jgi:hypothetical protein
VLCKFKNTLLYVNVLPTPSPNKKTPTPVERRGKDGMTHQEKQMRNCLHTYQK